MDGMKQEGGWKMTAKRCIMILPRARRAIIAATAALLLGLAGYFLLSAPPASSAAGERLKSAAQGLTAYDVTMRLQEHTLSLSETVDYRNDTGEVLTDLVLRTWVNAYSSEETSPAATEELYDACYPGGFSAGYVTLYDVMWNGQGAAHEYLDEAKTALRVKIPPLAPGERGQLLLRCVEKIPECAHRTGIVGNRWQLGNAVPLLSVYQDGAWRTDEYSPVGDPFVSSCANFSLTLYAPEGYVPACSAPLTLEKDGAWRGELLAARDIGLCVSPDYHQVSLQAGGVRLYSYADTEAGARRALTYAQRALETYAGLFGDYPYPALTLCSVDFPFGGMEYPGLCMISEGYYLDSRADSLELLVAHEAAHQWFYALVGSDQAKEPWQDEALCEYAMLRYIRARYGQGSYDTLRYYRVDSPMRENIPGSLTPGSPISYFGSLSDYAAVVYGRGAAMLLALEEWLPGGADAFLRAYAERFAFQLVTRAQFEAFLNDFAGKDASPLLLDYLDTAH